MVRRIQEFLGELGRDGGVALVEGIGVDGGRHLGGVRLGGIVVEAGVDLVEPERGVGQAHVLDGHGQGRVVRVDHIVAGRNLGGVIDRRRHCRLAEGNAGGGGDEQQGGGGGESGTAHV